MGEYAQEAFYLGMNQADYNFEKHKCIAPGDPRYDNSVWEDVTGKIRKIKDMDSMHLCFVLKQIYVMKRNSVGKFDLYKGVGERIPLIENELRRRSFTKEDYDFCLYGIRLGLYCFYEDENNTDLEQYYCNMLKSYKYFDPPKGLFD